VSDVVTEHAAASNGEPVAESAREALAAVVASLAEAPRPDHPGDLALLALLAEHVRRADGAAGEAALAAAGGLPPLEDAFARLADADVGFALHRGFTEVAWVAAHLWRGAPDLDEVLRPVDEALLSLLDQAWEGPFDLAFGLAGLGVYALERWPAAAATRLLEGVVRQLDALAEPSGGWRALRTRPDQVDLYGVEPPLRDSFAAEGYFELGMAHGVAGAVGVLARAVLAGAGGERARPLLGDLASWLAAAARPAGAELAFPGRLSRDLSAAELHRRSSWCKGDPGVALSLLAAGRALGRGDLRHLGLDAARRAALRSPAVAGISDACLCHGALGLGHVFRRLHQASGDPVLRAASARWTREALAMRQPGRGTGGYLARFHREDGTTYEARDTSFLTGAVGIGLGLAAVVSSADPSWDALLLASAGGPP
jgi:hypothetical protein